MSDRARPDFTDPSRSASRRTVLRAAGVVALTGGGVALAACSSDAEPATPAASSAAPASSAPASPGPASSATPSAAAPAGPSAATSDVPVGGGVVLEDADYVITQPTKGAFKAFTKICTHKGCSVAAVTGGNIECHCHGSKFSITDGSVTNPPASQPLKEFPVTVAGGKVVVTA